MARVLGRVRLSRLTDESTSEARQRELIQKYADANGHTVVGWAVDLDVSRSVNPFEAPDLGPWLTSPEKIIQWDVLVAWKLDRVAIGAVNLGKLLEFLPEHEKTLYSTSEMLDLSTWQGKMMASLMLGVAEGELELIRDRNRAGAKALREQGRWGGGKPQYWLWPVKQSTGWKLELNPETAPIMLRIIDEYLSGKPVSSTRDALTAEGIPTPFDYYAERKLKEALDAGIPDDEYAGKRPRGRTWKTTAITELLNSPELTGDHDYDGKPIPDDSGNPVQIAEPLIPHARFREIQAETARRKTLNAPRRDAGVGPLLGVIRCRECRGPVYFNTQRTQRKHGVYTYTYYRWECGHSGQIRADLATEEVHDTFIKVVGAYPRLTPKLVQATDHTEELEQAQANYKAVEVSQREARSDWERDRIRKQLRSLGDRIAELGKLPQSPARVEYRETGETYAEAWARMDTQERRLLMLDTGVQAFVKRTPEREVLVSMVFPAGLRARLGLDSGPGDSWELHTGNMPPSWEAQAVWEEEHADEIHAATWEQPPGPTS